MKAPGHDGRCSRRDGAAVPWKPPEAAGGPLPSRRGRDPQAMDMPLQPAQQLLLATLHRSGPSTVGSLAQQLRISQPTVTRSVLALIDQRLITASRKGRDQRHKTVTLSAKGKALIARARRDLW